MAVDGESSEPTMVALRLDPTSGVATYMQLVHQVRQAMQMGVLREGDQLPTVKDVVAELAINPNTVLKAYRELEHEGLVAGRPGVGTFVLRTLDAPSPQARERLLRGLAKWVDLAQQAGLDVDTMIGLIREVADSAEGEAVA